MFGCNVDLYYNVLLDNRITPSPPPPSHPHPTLNIMVQISAYTILSYLLQLVVVHTVITKAIKHYACIEVLVNAPLMLQICYDLLCIIKAKTQQYVLTEPTQCKSMHLLMYSEELRLVL